MKENLSLHPFKTASTLCTQITGLHITYFIFVNTGNAMSRKATVHDRSSEIKKQVSQNEQAFGLKNDNGDLTPIFREFLTK